MKMFGNTSLVIIWVLPQFVFAWTTPVNISNTSKPSNYPSITVDYKGRVHVVWSEDYFEVGKIFYVYHDGVAWSSPVDISRNDVNWPLYAPVIETDSNSRIHAVWDRNSSDIYWAFCDGDTWSIPVNISNTPGGSTGTRIAADDSGRIHIVWHDNSTGTVEIYYTMYDGESWQEAERITDSSGGKKCSWPDIAVDSSGYPHVVWTHYGGTGSSSDYWIQYSKYDGSFWSTPVDILRIEGEPIVEGRITMDAEGYPHAVAERWCYEAIYDTHYDGTSWTPPHLVYEGSHAGRPDIAIDAGSGIGCVAWGDRYYRFFKGAQWDSAGIIEGPGGVLPALAASSGTFHLVWATGDIYYSRHTLTSIESQEEYIPRGFRLNRNYPNPFFSKTMISYEIPQDSYVTLIISDSSGRIIEKIRLGYKPAGRHTVPILIDSLKKGGAYAGIYFYTLRAGNFAATRKMVVLH